MNKPTAVSIIVPIYNSKNYLAKCLDSLRRQSHDDVEFLLIDDGSTDGSGDIAQKYLCDSRFKYYRKDNGGASSARNLGINKARGCYFAFVDSDDIIHDQFLEHLISIALSSDADIVSGKKQNFDVQFEQKALDKNYFVIDSIQLLKNGFSCCARLFKRDLFFSPKVLFPENVWAEDNGYVPYLASRAKKIIFLSNDVYGYRRTGLSSATYSPRSIADSPKAMNYLLSICSNRSCVIYSSFVTMNSAILRLPFNNRSRNLEISRYLSTPDSIELLNNLKKIICLKDINLFSGMQKIYFIGFYLLAKGYRRSALFVYNLNTLKNMLRR